MSGTADEKEKVSRMSCHRFCCTGDEMNMTGTLLVANRLGSRLIGSTRYWLESRFRKSMTGLLLVRSALGFSTRKMNLELIRHVSAKYRASRSGSRMAGAYRLRAKR